MPQMSSTRLTTRDVSSCEPRVIVEPEDHLTRHNIPRLGRGEEGGKKKKKVKRKEVKKKKKKKK